MGNSLRRFISVALGFFLLMSLTACGNKSTESTMTQTSSQDEGFFMNGDEDEYKYNSKSADEKANASVTSKSTEDFGGVPISNKVTWNSSDPFKNIPKRLKGTSVKFATWGDETSAAYMKVIKAFEKKTEIKVEVVEYNQGNYSQSLATQIVNKTAPDVVIAGFPYAIEYLQPINKIIDLTDDFWDDTITEHGTIGSNTYFVNSHKGPWESYVCVFYNKYLFENNGITSPRDYYKSGNWTYETYELCATAISKLKGCMGTIPEPRYFSSQLGNPMCIYNNATKQFSNNVSGWIEAFQWNAGLKDKGLYDRTRGRGDFISDKVGMCTTEVFGAKYNGYFSTMTDSHLDAVPLPSSYKGKALNQAVSGSGRAYGICKGSKNPEGAAYFLRYFLDYSYYEAANADIFKNASLKKMYFEELAPIYNNKNRIFDSGSDLLSAAGYNMGDKFETPLKDASAAGVPTIINSNSNLLDAAVKKGNDFLANYK